MMASKVTLAIEEEGTEAKGAEKEEGTVKVAGSSVSTRGHFGRSWASLRQKKPALMAPMVVK